ncbi:hypothetical protein MCEMIH16_01721 [Caulobacteraceae bacterium]
MAWTDIVGVIGVAMILVAYAGAALGRLDVKGALSLSANFVGASLILLSLMVDFNLSALLMEGSWALVSLAGLVRLLVIRLRRAAPR